MPRAHETAAPSDTFPPDSFLIDHDLVTAFEVGWSVLHQDVSLFVAQQLISTLDDLHCVDRDVQRELVALRRTLVTQRDAGTPAEILAMLDMTVLDISARGEMRGRRDFVEEDSGFAERRRT